MTNEQKVTWLVSFSHCITHGYMTLLPALLVVITAEHSMSFLDIGVVANVGYFLYGLGAFPAGWLADRFGSKRVLSAGVLGMALSSLLIGLSPGAAGFALTYALLGVFASIHHPAGLSLIARRVRERKGKALGIHGVLGNVGLFLSPLTAAACVWLFGTWRAAYIIYGVVGLLFFLLLARAKIQDEADLRLGALLRRKAKEQAAARPRPEGGAKEDVLIPAALLLLYVGSILSGFIFRGSLTFFPTLLQRNVLAIASHDEPVVVAGFVTTAILSLGLVGAWFGGWINDRLRRPEFFPAAVFALAAPALYGLYRLEDTRLLAVGAAYSLVYYAWQPAQNYLIARYTRHASHGKGFGVNFFLIFGIGSVATATGGYVTDTWGVDYFYGIMAAFALTAMVVAAGVYFVRPYRLRCRLQWERIEPDRSEG